MWLVVHRYRPPEDSCVRIRRMAKNAGLTAEVQAATPLQEPEGGGVPAVVVVVVLVVVDDDVCVVVIVPVPPPP